MLRLLLVIALANYCHISWANAPKGKTASFYYGPDIPWSEMSLFDYPVVEPDQASAVPSAYRDSRFYAYVSVGEVLKNRRYFDGIRQHWFLGENPDWGSLVLDQSNATLHDFFIDHVISPLWQQGYKGFFLDTLDSYQLIIKSDQGREAQREGLAALINAISSRFPEARFILNRGFELLPLLDAKVDAVAAESLFQRWVVAEQAFQEVPENDRAWLLGEFRRVSEAFGVDTIAIDYAPASDREQARELAQKIADTGVIPWVTNPELDMMGLGIREVMPRRVLLVYGGSTERLWELTDAVRYGLMPLQFQGLVPDIRAIDSTMPAGTLRGRYAGIVTWLEEEEVASSEFEAWLAKQKNAGVPVAMVGYPAVDPAGPFGNEFGFEPLPTPQRPPVITQQHEAMGFESPLPSLIELPVPINNTSALPWLALRSGDQQYAPVAMTEWGGYALQPFVIRSVLPGVKTDGQDRWMFNPLTFFREALQLPAMPIPDVTTENGRRLLFAHMDGDGFPSLAEVKGYQGKADALVLLNEILKKFDIPTTVSVIEGELAPHGLYPGQSEELERIARGMFALPHVEAATHTYSHPFYWYDSQANPGDLYGPEGQLRLPIPDYRMDPEREVIGSADYINNNLLPPGKRTVMVLWSGDTIPTPEALEAARKGGLLNMNGSDTTITESAPTWTLIKGIGIPKGDEYQVYAPNQNENIYTHEWSGPYYGFERVLETFRLTEQPHRFKPVDIYYHTYITSKNAALESLRRVYQWASEQPFHPVFASEYARKVLDFNDMAIAQEGNDWIIRGRGDLRTLRLPDGVMLPAMANGEGLAGYRDDKPGRYLHLSSGEARWQEGEDDQPYLQQANARLTGFARSSQGLTFSLSGYAPLEFSLGNAGKCHLTHKGRRMEPVSRQGALNHYRSAKHELDELRLQCSH